MKRLVMVGAALAVFGTTALAGPEGPQAPPPQGLPPACCPADLPVSRAAALLEVIKLERRLAAGVPAGERKQLLAEIDRKIAELDVLTAQDAVRPMPPCPAPPTADAADGQQVQQSGDTVTITLPGGPAPGSGQPEK